MSKIELPIAFSHYFEVERREKFDPLHLVTLENYKNIIGECHFSEEVKCQLHVNKGLCGKAHQHGWLAITKDNKEALIGGICAKKYFNADEKFKSDRARVSRELKILGTIKELEKYLSNKAVFEENFQTLQDKIISIRENIKDLKDFLPSSMISRIDEMEKTGNRNVSIEIQYIEKDEENDKQKIDWVVKTIGAMKGTAIFDHDRMVGIFSTIKEIKKTLSEAIVDRESGLNNLSRWAKSLSKIDYLKREISFFEESQKNFNSKKNLFLCIFINKSHSDQVLASKAYLEKHKGYFKKQEATDLISNYRKKLMEENMKRNIRFCG